MQSTASTPEEYMNNLPEERKAIMAELRKAIIQNLPQGFEEMISYEMLSYVVRIRYTRRVIIVTQSYRSNF
jgi:hypothetical protein